MREYVILMYYEVETELSKEELKELIGNNKVKPKNEPKILVLEKV